MEDMQRAWVEIDLDAISHNVKEIKNIIRPDVKLMAVVKADAYGHGAYEVAKTCLESGAERLAVAFVDEAVELRRKGIDVPVLLLGVSMPEAIESIIKYDITPAVAGVDFAKQLSKAAATAQKTVKIHIKADTGMFRIGFQFTGDSKHRLETVEKIVEISKLPNIEIEGMVTHLSTADEEGRDYTKQQFENFMELDEKLKARGVQIPIRHIANSAGQIRYPELQLDMVRAGIILYGLYPSDEVSYSSRRYHPYVCGQWHQQTTGTFIA